MTTKNRKSFIAVIQISKKRKGPRVKARIYRIKQNIPVFIGDVDYLEMFPNAGHRDAKIELFLKYHGHVLAGHTEGNEFLLNVV